VFTKVLKDVALFSWIAWCLVQLCLCPVLLLVLFCVEYFIGDRRFVNF
jgi:hypothetical protein